MLQSPITTAQQLHAFADATGNLLAAGRVTNDHVNSVITSEEYVTLPGTNVIICSILLLNGTRVTGVNYGSINPAAYSEERGREEARKEATNKVWELEGYLLRHLIASRDCLHVAHQDMMTSRGSCNE